MYFSTEGDDLLKKYNICDRIKKNLIENSFTINYSEN